MSFGKVASLITFFPWELITASDGGIPNRENMIKICRAQLSYRLHKELHIQPADLCLKHRLLGFGSWIVE